MNAVRKIVVFTSALRFSVRKGIVDLRHALPDAEILILLHQPPRPAKTLLRNQWRNLRRNGWRWIPYQTADIVGRLASRGGQTMPIELSAPGSAFTRQRLVAMPQVSLQAIDNINGPEAVSALKAFAPDLGVSLAAPILKPQVFEVPRLGTINLHKGKLPDYRGMPPAFWELWNGEHRIGCSVHKVRAKLDAGELLASDTAERQRFSTLKGLQLTLDEVGIGLMTEAVCRLDSGSATFTPQAPGGKTNRKPTLSQIAQLQRKMTQPDGTGMAKRLIKDSVFGAYSKVLSPVARRVRGLRGNQRIVILMYHRVNDELRDGVTVGIEQFNWQMQYLRKHYPLLSVQQIIDGDFPTNSARPLIAVTFDDGYLDNYQHAAPILLRHGVPATFFVSTGLMGTDQGFQHDIAKLGRPLRNMTWVQLREMVDMGFDIGSHTVNHINCGKTDLQTVREELQQSKLMLERKLGLERVLFAYPFGGRDDMVREALEAVKALDYACCMSAYGGVNSSSNLDKFNILRTGVNYNFTRRAFAALTEGWD